VALERGEGPAAPPPPVLSAGQIQDEVLDTGTVLLVYALGERRSYLWALTRTRLVSAALPPRAELEEGALRLHDLLVGSRMHRDLTQAALVARDLSRRLLGPAVTLLAGRRVAVVPDGALAYLPFGYLPEPGGEAAPLLAAHEVVELPSASVMAAIRRRTAGRPPARRRLAVLADPLVRQPDAGGHAPVPGIAAASFVRQAPAASDVAVSRSLEDLGLRQLAPLPYAREEAAAILQLVPPAERLGAVGAAASCDLVREGSLAPYAIVHFAVHALVHPSLPDLSGLVLAARDRQGQPQPGFLQSYEIADLRLPADLVVLSACSTGLGRELRGEGLVGLTQSFFQAGAARVLVSLWNVDDQATARLMELFYRELLANGRPPAGALRAAQLALQRDARWVAPYYWAGFEMEGDWRPLR
jgi:CHAT domain-containing protein